MPNNDSAALMTKILSALVLLGSLSSHVAASVSREAAKTDVVSDVVERIEADKLFLNTNDIRLEQRDSFRILILLRQMKLALIRGKRAEYDDFVVKIVVDATNSPERFREFRHEFASVLSLASELGWSVSNESTLELYRVSTAPPSDQLSSIHNKISYAFETARFDDLLSSINRLPELTEASNSWEIFVRALADYRYYLLSGEQTRLTSAIALLENISSDTSKALRVGMADKSRLFDARVRLQLVSAYIALEKETFSKAKQGVLEQAFATWNDLNYPALLIDHPALWGAHMHLYSEILSATLAILTEDKASEVTDQIREIAHRRDEADFMASRYR